jgi:hypothetical protein
MPRHPLGMSDDVSRRVDRGILNFGRWPGLRPRSTVGTLEVGDADGTAAPPIGTAARQ